MLGFTILIGFLFLGEFLVFILSLPLPGNVLGLILFVTSLFTGLVKLDWVESTSNFLLKHLALFFVPVIVATMTVFSSIADNLVLITVSLIVSTLIVLISTGWTVKIASNKKGDL